MTDLSARACLYRLVQTASAWLRLSDPDEKRRAVAEFRAAHGDIRTEEVLGLVRAVNAGKVRLTEDKVVPVPR